MSEGNQLVHSVSGWIFPLRVRNFISRQTRLGIVYNIHLALNLFTVCWQQSLVTHTHTNTLTLSGLISSNIVKYAEDSQVPFLVFVSVSFLMLLQAQYHLSVSVLQMELFGHFL